jgi:hypothetical protein
MTLLKNTTILAQRLGSAPSLVERGKGQFPADTVSLAVAVYHSSSSGREYDR